MGVRSIHKRNELPFKATQGNQEKLITKSRKIEYLENRGFLCVILRANNVPFKRIGKILGQDHTTIMSLVRSTTTKLEKNAVLKEELKELYEEYRSHYEGDSGVDLYIPEEVIIEKGNKRLIGHGIKTKMTDERGEDVSYYLYARSSIVKTPLMVHNSVGIIDSGYRGEIKGSLLKARGEDYVIERKQRLFQICAPNLGKIRVEVVEKLDETERGEGGFGSTGK